MKLILKNNTIYWGFMLFLCASMGFVLGGIISFENKKMKLKEEKHQFIIDSLKQEKIKQEKQEKTLDSIMNQKLKDEK